MECCCQCSCSNCRTVFHATVSFSTQTYRHNYPQASPKRCQKVVESTVWYGSLECPFSPSTQKMINKKKSHFLNKRFLYFLTHLSGRPNRNSLSNRPGRLRAGSMASSLFVAPMTTTSPLESNPSISAKRVDTMELWRQQSVFTPNILKSSLESMLLTCVSDPDDWT